MVSNQAYNAAWPTCTYCPGHELPGVRVRIFWLGEAILAVFSTNPPVLRRMVQSFCAVDYLAIVWLAHNLRKPILSIFPSDLREPRRTLAQHVCTDAAAIVGGAKAILADGKYPDWLYHLLDKKSALSELERKKPESMAENEVVQFLKLDNRRRIKENNSLKAK